MERNGGFRIKYGKREERRPKDKENEWISVSGGVGHGEHL